MRHGYTIPPPHKPPRAQAMRMARAVVTEPFDPPLTMSEIRRVYRSALQGGIIILRNWATEGNT